MNIFYFSCLFLLILHYCEAICFSNTKYIPPPTPKYFSQKKVLVTLYCRYLIDVLIRLFFRISIYIDIQQIFNSTMKLQSLFQYFQIKEIKVLLFYAITHNVERIKRPNSFLKNSLSYQRMLYFYVLILNFTSQGSGRSF